MNGIRTSPLYKLADFVINYAGNLHTAILNLGSEDLQLEYEKVTKEELQQIEAKHKRAVKQIHSDFPKIQVELEKPEVIQALSKLDIFSAQERLLRDKTQARKKALSGDLTILGRILDSLHRAKTSYMQLYMSGSGGKLIKIFQNKGLLNFTKATYRNLLEIEKNITSLTRGYVKFFTGKGLHRAAQNW